MIITEQFQAKWFALPKELLQDYATRIGIEGIAVYAFIASHCDDAFECIMPLERIKDNILLTSSQLREVLAVLKDTRLLKYDPYGEQQTLFTLLWQA